MSLPGGRSGRIRARYALPAALLALGATVPVLPASAATAKSKAHHVRRHHGFPVPTCRWVPTSLISRTLGVQVRALPGVWSTQVAPVLTCGFVERQPNLQFGNVPIAVVQFRELQRFRPDGWTPVRHLGSCVRHSSCPAKTGPAAYQIVRHTTTTTTTTPTGTTPSGTTPTTTSTTPTDTTPPSTQTTFVSGVALHVEDGLNFLAITVENPDGPLPVADEIAGARSLAGKLLGPFRWH